MTVDLQGDATYGQTTFHDDAAGRHRVAWDVDRLPALDFVLGRICS